MAATPDATPEEKALSELIGNDARCVVCGQWVPPFPVDQWIIVVGPDRLGVAHNYASSLCIERSFKDWELIVAHR